MYKYETHVHTSKLQVGFNHRIEITDFSSTHADTLFLSSFNLCTFLDGIILNIAWNLFRAE